MILREKFGARRQVVNEKLEVPPVHFLEPVTVDLGIASKVSQHETTDSGFTPGADQGLASLTARR